MYPVKHPAMNLMQFTGFTLMPAYNRDVSSSIAEQRQVGAVLEASGFLQLLPKCRELEVEVYDPVLVAETSLADAHGDWTETYFPEVKTPEGMRRQPIDSICPIGLFKVTVSCIEKRCPGMGSHYGFVGLYVSLLVSVAENVIWDARCEQAT